MSGGSAAGGESSRFSGGGECGRKEEMSKIGNMRVTVTGGAGFIGSNLVERLLAQGNEVTCLDDFSTGKRENIEEFLGNPRFRLLEGDIRDPKACAAAVEGAEVVLHEAALGSVPGSIADPVRAEEVNLGGFVKMLWAAKQAGVRRFVYAASSAAYGDATELPQVEGRIGRPLSPYATTKVAGEWFARNFSDLYGLETVGLRYFNVFGRKQDPHGAYAAVIPLFAKALLEGRPPVVNGDGRSTRDYTHVDNVVLANELAATTDNPAALGEVYNVGCGVRTDLLELVALLQEALLGAGVDARGVRAVHGPERPGDIVHSVADVSKARRLLGYVPAVGVREGLAATAAWYAATLGRRG